MKPPIILLYRYLNKNVGCFALAMTEFNIEIDFKPFSFIFSVHLRFLPRFLLTQC